MTKPVSLLVTLVLCAFVSVALAQPSARSSATPAVQGPSQPASSASAELAASASVSASPPVPPAPDSVADEPPPRVVELRRITERIAALRAGELDTAVDPQSLFDVTLDDEAAIAVEKRRLQRVVRESVVAPELVEQPVEPTASASASASASAPAAPPGAASASPSVSASAASPEVPPAEVLVDAPTTPEAQLFEARLALDEARLGFYALPRAERERMLAQHAQRRSKDSSSQTRQDILDADQRAQAAEESRLRALEEARRAQTEAARALAEEQARLSGIERRQAELEAELMRVRERLGGSRELTLGWQRRVREAIDARSSGSLRADEVDPLYDELRTNLRSARSELDSTLAALSSAEVDVPSVGPSSLGELAIDLDTSAVEAQRRALEQKERELVILTREVQRARSAVLLDRIEKLNTARLSLTPWLSSDKRDDVRGFASPGRDQAAAELWQVALVMRAHLRGVRNYAESLARSGSARTDAALSAGWLILQWTLPIGLLLWWRRRAPGVLEAAQERARDAQRREGHLRRGLIANVLDVVAKVRSTLELALLLVLLHRLLPTSLTTLLEVRLGFVVLGWTVGGAFVVRLIDALAERGSVATARITRMQTSQLRFASLRLVGRAVVIVGSLLAVTSRIVGEGTIYHWVFSLCWFAAIPMSIVILRWWRPVVFELASRRSKRSELFAWVASKRDGWSSLGPAAVGGLVLVAVGIWRRVRTWTSNFELTQRVLAYLFRREMSRRGADAAELGLAPLDEATRGLLGPQHLSELLVKSAIDAESDALLERIARPGGGVFAVVGERGLGKSTLLSRIRTIREDRTIVASAITSLDQLRTLLIAKLGLPGDASDEVIARVLEDPENEHVLLVDDAQRLIRPTMGGLEEFDRILELSRRYSRHCVWVFALDQVVWRFFELARGARPVFDDVLVLRRWPEEAIARLLRTRSKAAGLSPNFDRVMEKLPETADELDVEQARAATEAAYYRMIWDHAEGNPGVALHAWSDCLGSAEDGACQVKVFRPVDIRELECLPDSAVFVLRAVVRLEEASAVEIAQATMIPMAKVQDALRYGRSHGFFERVGDKHRLSWTWYRTVTRFLQRRYLLQPERSNA
jgi:hypothetical protein